MTVSFISKEVYIDVPFSDLALMRVFPGQQTFHAELMTTKKTSPDLEAMHLGFIPQTSRCILFLSLI